MTQRSSVEAFPLYWPEGWKRTSFRESSRFKTGFGAARQFLILEIERMGGHKTIISSNISLRNDGLPRANMPQPSDPGIAVYFTRGGKEYVFACDKFSKTHDNIYAIAKTIEAMRGIERWGASDMMERAFTGFSALPAKAAQWWRHPLGFDESQIVTADDVQSRFRELAHSCHPDKSGGNSEQFMLINQARDAALAELRNGA